MSRKQHSPLKKVKRAFDREALKRVCEMHESEFEFAYDMEKVEINELGRHPDDDFYLFRDNDAKVLAVAHLDTVMPHEGRTANIIDTEAGPVIFSGALDDRLGAYIILELLPAIGIKYDLLLTVGEESGQSTAEFFDAEKDYDWMIEFDRGGTDVVMYQYEDSYTMSLVRATGAVVGNGIFSDISYLGHLGIKGFNWGVGYEDYHGPRSHAFLNDTLDMVAKYVKFHRNNAGTSMPHREDADSWWGGFGRGRGRSRSSAYTTSLYGMSGLEDDDFEFSDWEVCDYCHKAIFESFHRPGVWIGTDGGEDCNDRDDGNFGHRPEIIRVAQNNDWPTNEEVTRALDLLDAEVIEDTEELVGVEGEEIKIITPSVTEPKMLNAPAKEE